MDNSSHSFESVWATLDRIGAKLEQSSAKFDQEMAASRAKFDQEMAASRAKFDQEMAASRAEAAQRAAEADQRAAIAEKETQALRKFLDQVSDTVKQTGLQLAGAEKYIKDLCQQVGGIANSNGAAAEEYFYNSLLNGNKELLGEKYDYVWGSTPGREAGFKDEYDIVLLNGHSVCVVEVKYKADSADFAKLLRKPVTFRENYPKYKNHKVYVALAGMSFSPLTEKACQDNGIAIMKQVGDTIAIYDKHLKAF